MYLPVQVCTEQLVPTTCAIDRGIGIWIDHGHPFLSFCRSVQLRLLLSVFDCLKCFDKFVFGLRVKGRLVYPSLGYCKRERY